MGSITFLRYVLILFLVLNYSKHAGSTLGDKWQQLNNLNLRSPVINMNNDLFKSLVRSTPRNYSIIAMFTAMDTRRGCSVCGEAYGEFLIAATSYRYSRQYPGDVFFAVVDFDKTSEAFQMLKINTAPMFLHFSPKSSYKNYAAMDMFSGISAEIIAKWVNKMTGAEISVLRPPNYAGTVGLLISVSLFGFLLYMRRNNLEFLFNKTLWAVNALLFTFVMCSGQMWNHIRGPPFLRRSRDQTITYIDGNSQSQLIVESYIIIGISALTSVGLILMIEAARARSDKSMAVVGILLYAFCFSLMLSIFRKKSHGYPYSFLLA